MTVQRDEQGNIVLQGHCSVEDAEPLFQMLQANPEAAVDWSGCTHVHTAIVQLLMAAGRHFTGPCGDSLVGRLF